MKSLAMAMVLLGSVMMTGCERSVPKAMAEEPTPTPVTQPALGPGDSLPGPGDMATTAPATSPAVAPPSTYPAAAGAYESQQAPDDFHEALAPYGQWVDVPDYGNCWQPANVPPGWLPYTDGYWAYANNYGWTWASNEPFGWCCYHYGRWAAVPGYGWCWVPGRLWGPAWVVWRQGGGFCGWAPLPPSRQGTSLGAEIAGLSPFCFVFVNERFLDDRDFRQHVEPVTRNVTILQQTQNITRIDRVGGRFVNRGIPVEQFERVTGRPITRFSVAAVGDPRETGVQGGRISVFRPQLAPGRLQPPGEAHQAAERMPRAISPLTSQQLEAREAQRQAYYQRLQNEMQERHQRELQQPAPNLSRQQLQSQQLREQRSFQEQQQRMAPQREAPRQAPAPAPRPGERGRQ